jgi:hypothetical protein
MPVSFPLSDIAVAALDFGRTVECSSHVNDFQAPALERQHDPPVWTTADGLIYDPGTLPQP